MRDRVTPELRESVLRRDGRCVLSRFDAAHECRDVWGREHEADDLDRLTIEHVKTHLRLGRRAPSDAGHCLALCGYRNVIRPPTKVERGWMRDYLAAVTA